MTDFTKYDAIVVGCGLMGGIVSRYMAEKQGKRVLILERRDHIAGNLYDYKDEDGILVQKYGPHTFHTYKKEIFDYVTQFGEWDDYAIKCRVEMDGKQTPSPFNFQTIDDFYSPEDAEKLKARIKEVYGDADKTTIVEMLESTDPLIKEYADFLFAKDYSLYTAKQWGISPSEIDVSVLKRVPVLFSYKDGYFDDTYQIMPKEGFTEFFRRIIDHPAITVELNVDSSQYIRVEDGVLLLQGKPCTVPVVYTGPVDELLGLKYGPLPYRSLRFDFRTEQTDSYQSAPIVAYPQAPDFTRITEFKKMTGQQHEKTVIAVEYPQSYEKGTTEPYYPILTEQSMDTYEKYRSELSGVENLILCGRLADYKYYNMDQAVERALQVCAQL